MSGTRPAPSAQSARSALATGALLAAPLAFLAVFFVAPVGAIVARGLTDGAGTLDVGALADLVTDPHLRGVAWFTLWQAVVSTVATVIIALPMAYVLGRLDFAWKPMVQALIVVPFVLPTIVVGTAFVALLGPDGPLAGPLSTVGVTGFDLRQTVPAIILAHVFFNYAVVARTVGSAWGTLSLEVEHAGRTLGASPLQTFLHVTLPALRPAIAGASSIVFLFSFTSFGVVKVLGGPQVATIEVEIHRLTTDLLDLRSSAALSLLQMAAVAATLVVNGRLAGRARGRSGAPAGFRRPVGRQRQVLWATLASAAVLVLLPLCTLAERSVKTSDGYGLRFYRSLTSVGRGTSSFVPPTEAIRNSVVFGIAAAAIALVTGTLAAIAIERMGRVGGRATDTALTLPLGTSAVTVGFGFLIALDEPPLDLRTSPLLIPAAQALIAMPFVIRTVLPAIRSIDPTLRDAAATLGASPRRVRVEVDLRLLVAPVLVAAGFALAISLGEFGATVFIARADAPTVPVAIFRSLSRPGALNFGQAMALSTILMTLTASVMLLVDRFRGDSVGSFV